MSKQEANGSSGSVVQSQAGQDAIKDLLQGRVVLIFELLNFKALSFETGALCQRNILCKILSKYFNI